MATRRLSVFMRVHEADEILKELQAAAWTVIIDNRGGVRQLSSEQTSVAACCADPWCRFFLSRVPPRSFPAPGQAPSTGQFRWILFNPPREIERTLVMAVFSTKSEWGQYGGEAGDNLDVIEDFAKLKSLLRRRLTRGVQLALPGSVQQRRVSDVAYTAEAKKWAMEGGLLKQTVDDRGVFSIAGE